MKRSGNNEGQKGRRRVDDRRRNAAPHRIDLRLGHEDEGET
jgi:hypothetical protein